jgi:hypothetical protein
VQGGRCACLVPGPDAGFFAVVLQTLFPCAVRGYVSV